MMDGLQSPVQVCRHVSDTLQCLLQSSVAVPGLSRACNHCLLGSALYTC